MADHAALTKIVLREILIFVEPQGRSADGTTPPSMDPVQTIIYAASAEDKAQDLLTRFLRLLPILWFVLEVVVLVQVGRAIGGLAVAALLLGGVLAGGMLLRHAGMKVVTSMMVRAQVGPPPLERLRSAGWQVVAGLLLILPGFLSDVLALLLFVPPVRGLITRLVPRARRQGSQTVVIEGEVQDLTPDPEVLLRDHPTAGGEADQKPSDEGRGIAANGQLKRRGSSGSAGRPSPWSRPGGT